jgi:Rv2175c C-terminal domain of unknown function
MSTDNTDDLDGVATGWLPLPDLAEQLGETVSTLRLWVRERKLIVIERGTPPIKQVPSDFVRDGHLLKGLTGALTVLRDAGFSERQAVRWLLTDSSALEGRPVDLMAAGRDVAVKRHAMSLAF